jgi:hypothetical protein
MSVRRRLLQMIDNDRLHRPVRLFKQFGIIVSLSQHARVGKFVRLGSDNAVDVARRPLLHPSPNKTARPPDHPESFWQSKLCGLNEEGCDSGKVRLSE